MTNISAEPESRQPRTLYGLSYKEWFQLSECLPYKRRAHREVYRAYVRCAMQSPLGVVTARPSTIAAYAHVSLPTLKRITQDLIVCGFLEPNAANWWTGSQFHAAGSQRLGYILRSPKEMLEALFAEFVTLRGFAPLIQACMCNASAMQMHNPSLTIKITFPAPTRPRSGGRGRLTDLEIFQTLGLRTVFIGQRLGIAWAKPGLSRGIAQLESILRPSGDELKEDTSVHTDVQPVELEAPTLSATCGRGTCPGEVRDTSGKSPEASKMLADGASLGSPCTLTGITVIPVTGITEVTKCNEITDLPPVASALLDSNTTLLEARTTKGTGNAVASVCLSKPSSKEARIPTIEEMELYCNSRRSQVDPRAIYDHCEAIGWLHGNQPLDWKAEVRRAERQDYSECMREVPMTESQFNKRRRLLKKQAAELLNKS